MRLAPLPGSTGAGPESRPTPVRRRSPVPVMVASDILALVIAAAAVFDLRLEPNTFLDVAVVVFPLVGIAMLVLRGAYRWSPRDAALEQIGPLIGGIGVATLVCIGISAAGQDAISSRQWIVTWGLGSLLVILGRALLGLVHRARLVRGTGQRPTLIVGAGTIGARVARRLAGAPDYGLRPVGFLDDQPMPAELVGGRPAPILGGMADLDAVIAKHGIRQVIVAFGPHPDRDVVRLVRRCEQHCVDVALVPRLFDLWNHRTAYDPIGGLPVLHLQATDLRSWQFAVKHASDRIIAAVMLAVLSPVLLAVALAVRLTSSGPVLFRQDRVGIDGARFELLKFRSMREPVPPSGTAAASSRDELLNMPHDAASGIAPGGVEGLDRRTGVGRLIRRTSIDELPQLVNVLRGEMSLVGPRPERPEFVDRFAPLHDRYEERHRVKSGITGWAQIHGLRGKTSVADRIEMDNFYIEHFSLALDLRILLRTVAVVFRGAE